MKEITSKEYKTYKPTREEDFIKYYFDDLNISYKRELTIHNLEWDTKKSRRVDFYLDKLDLYVEYYGLYNSTKEIRNEYDKKTQVYFKNGLATIILYPHELGFLDYAFHSKVVKLFKIEKFRERKNKFFRYMFNRYFKLGKWRQFLTGIFWTYLFAVFAWEMVTIDESLNAVLIIISFVMAAWAFINLILDAFSFFKTKGILN